MKWVDWMGLFLLVARCRLGSGGAVSLPHVRGVRVDYHWSLCVFCGRFV